MHIVHDHMHDNKRRICQLVSSRVTYAKKEVWSGKDEVRTLVLGSTQTQCVIAVMVSSAPGGYKYPSWDSHPPVGLLPSPSKACCLTSCLQKGSFIRLEAFMFWTQLWLDESLPCQGNVHFISFDTLQSGVWSQL